MAKLVVQSKGSEKDPKFADQMISVGEEDISFVEYLQGHSIQTLEQDLVNSCHGCPELNRKHSGQIQAIADAGNQVVCVESGGLYFAKPSIEAANMPTIPVISVPLDGGYFGGLDAFMAPQVPTGTAVIAGVGINRYDLAARAAKEILTNRFDGVYTYHVSDRVREKLREMKIEINASIYDISEAGQVLHDGLIIGTLSPAESDQIFYGFDDLGSLGILAIREAEHTDDAHRLMDLFDGIEKSVYVRGEENMALFVAKIMSAYRPDLASYLKDAARKKAATYLDRDITIDSFTR